MNSASPNEPMCSLTHLIGTLLSIAGLVLLVVFASLKGNAWHVITFAIFGASMVLLYLASTLLHFFHRGTRARKIFQKIDHSLIYVLIAGTYTPVTLIVLKGWVGWTMFGIIWGLAVFGIFLKSLRFPRFQIVSTITYILMGWLIVLAISPLVRVMPSQGVWWLVAGGLFYTFGTIFFALDSMVPRTKWWGMHEMFHLFIMAGSFCHFWMMFKYVLYL